MQPKLQTDRGIRNRRDKNLYGACLVANMNPRAFRGHPMLTERDLVDSQSEPCGQVFGTSGSSIDNETGFRHHIKSRVRGVVVKFGAKSGDGSALIVQMQARETRGRYG